MTYLQLKSLSPQELLDLLRRTLASVSTVETTLEPPSPLPAPILFQLGDFEIRARFLDQRGEELNLEPVRVNPFTTPLHPNDV